MRYIIAFFITIGLVVLILFLLLSGGGSKQTATSVNLTKYVNSSARAQLIIKGPVVADENHQEVEIDVTRDQVAMTVYKGYQRTILTTKSYPNNDNAFNEFLYSLQRAGYSKGNADKAVGDERGYCVAGERNVYTFNDGSKDLFRFWSTSCGPKTFGGDAPTTTLLFEKQVPDFGTLTENLSFSI